jgi:hypothetical protein
MIKDGRIKFNVDKKTCNPLPSRDEIRIKKDWPPLVGH